jgi:hypothetical protein
MAASFEPLQRKPQKTNGRNLVPKLDLKRYDKRKRYFVERDNRFAKGRKGRFRTTRWNTPLVSAQLAAEGRLGP